MNVLQLRYGADNLSYLVSAGEEAIAIDGGAAADILAVLSERRARLVAVVNTHGHGDHTPGNARLCKATGAKVRSPEELARAGSITFGTEALSVLATPGPTRDSICFLGPSFVITGDTLFNGTVGNCFSGDLQAFYRSLQALAALPDGHLVYAGHDYVKDSMAFAKHLEPVHPAWDEFIRSYDPARVVSTLAQEKRLNPYLRWNDPGIVAILEDQGLPTATDFERFQSLMKLG